MLLSGVGDGTPFQYSCLENPTDRGAWRAAVHGVAQSQTRLKWLSSSSSVTEKGNFNLIHTHFVCCVALNCFSCVRPTLCNPMDYRLPGSSVHGILQERILEWVPMPSSRGSSPPRDWTHFLSVSFGRWVPFYQHHLMACRIGWLRSLWFLSRGESQRQERGKVSCLVTQLVQSRTGIINQVHTLSV